MLTMHAAVHSGQCNLSHMERYRSLRHVYRTIYPIIDATCNQLSATEVAAFLCALRIPTSGELYQKFLSPLRDFPEHEPWITEILGQGAAVLLVGKHVSTLMTRITNPCSYWASYTQWSHAPALTIWIAATPPQRPCDFGVPRGVLTALRHHFCLPPQGALESRYFLATDKYARDWYSAQSPNDQKIRAVFYYTFNPTVEGPIAHIFVPSIAQQLCTGLLRPFMARLNKSFSNLQRPTITDSIRNHNGRPRICFINLHDPLRVQSVHSLINDDATERFQGHVHIVLQRIGIIKTKPLTYALF